MLVKHFQNVVSNLKIINICLVISHVCIKILKKPVIKPN